MIQRIPLLARFILAMTLFDSAFAKDEVDVCLQGVDALLATASDYGTRVSDTARAKSIAQACESAEQQAPQSTSLKLATARALVWAGRHDAALVRLEQIMEAEQSASDLSAGLCAQGAGSQRVVSTTCDWVSSYPPSDPALALAAGQRLLKTGSAEAGLTAIGLAAQGGDQQAIRFATQSCLSFDPADPAHPLPDPAFKSVDPVFVAALSCEAAFTSLDENAQEWAGCGFNYVSAMTYFDNYAGVGGALLDLAQSADSTTSQRAIDTAVSLCTALAGDPRDSNVGASGVEDHQVIIDRALPACETAAFVAPSQGAMHYNLSRVYGLSGDTSGADEAYAEAERLGYALATGSSPYGGGNPGGGSGSAAVLSPSGGIAFDKFQRGDWIRALHDRDTNTLVADRTQVILYLQALVSTLHDEQVWFRVGTQYQLLLDPSLDVKLGAVSITDSQFMSDVTGMGLNIGLDWLKEFAAARKSTTERGVIDPVYEMTQSNKALMKGVVPLNVLANQAKQDGYRLLELYTASEPDFVSVYSGIKAFVNTL